MHKRNQKVVMPIHTLYSSNLQVNPISFPHRRFHRNGSSYRPATIRERCHMLNSLRLGLCWYNRNKRICCLARENKADQLITNCFFGSDRIDKSGMLLLIQKRPGVRKSETKICHQQPTLYTVLFRSRSDSSRLRWSSLALVCL